MSRVYVFSENPQLAAELVTTAATLGEVHAVCIGAAAAATLLHTGATSVVALEADQSRPEAYAPALARLVGERGCDLLLVGATVSGWEIAARAATILGIGLVSEATALDALPDGAWRSERIMYAGGAVQTETWTGPAVVTIAQGQAAAASGGAVDVETVVVDTDARVRVVARTARERASTNLASAARVVCVGMGVKKVEDLALAGDLADALGAEMACTRPVAEDREWLPVEQYIGISGVKVRPDLYVGLGVSGQVQHTIGIRDAKVVVGINTDPDATLFAVCDYAVVGSLYEIVPLLAAAVRDR